MSWIECVYNRITHSLYKVLPITEVNVSELFPEKANKSFHMMVAMRYLFVEYAHESEGEKEIEKIELYRKALCLTEEDQNKDIKHFSKLIKNIDHNGFNRKKPILMDKDKNVTDGSHRLAASIYAGIDRIYVRVIPRHLMPMSASQKIKTFNLSKKEEEEIINTYSRLYLRIRN